MTVDFNKALEFAKELAKEHGRVMVVFKHHGDHEVVCLHTYEALFGLHGLPKVATVSPSGKISQ